MPTDGKRRDWRLLSLALAGLLLAAAVVGQETPPDAEPDETADEKTAKQYDQFRKMVARQADRFFERLVVRYKLREAQKKNAWALTDKHGELFFKRHGRDVFDLIQRGRALRQLARESGMTWQEMPLDVKRDLAGRALRLIDAVAKELGDFSSAFAEGLDPEQKKILATDRRRMEFGFRMARFQMRLMSGQARPEERPTPPDEGEPGEGPDRPDGRRPRDRRRRPPARPAGPRLGHWERYVRDFIQKHRLDAIQKLQAMDLLAKYKAKAVAAAKRPTTQPASRPGREDTSLKAFRSRLESIRLRREKDRKLFEQLKAELEKIPTPVQRKLAAEAGWKASTRPAGRGR